MAGLVRFEYACRGAGLGFAAMNSRRLACLFVIIAAALSVSGCSDEGKEASADSTATVTATVTETILVDSAPSTIATSGEDGEEVDGGNGVGESYDNLGATVTIESVSEGDEIDLLEGGTVSAGDGAKYVIIEALVENNAKTSMDLTCSYPIADKLIDEEGREFDAIEDLYDVPGNPGCNDLLQPGFSSEMKWIYRVPSDAEVVAWSFTDVTDFEADPSDPTIISLEGAITH